MQTDLHVLALTTLNMTFYANQIHLFIQEGLINLNWFLKLLW